MLSLQRKHVATAKAKAGHVVNFPAFDMGVVFHSNWVRGTSSQGSSVHGCIQRTAKMHSNCWEEAMGALCDPVSLQSPFQHQKCIVQVFDPLISPGVSCT